MEGQWLGPGLGSRSACDGVPQTTNLQCPTSSQRAWTKLLFASNVLRALHPDPFAIERSQGSALGISDVGLLHIEHAPNGRQPQG